MTAESRPFLSVVRGQPTDEEVAGLVVVFASRTAPVPAAPSPAVDGWSANWRAIGAPVPPGPGAWQAGHRLR